MASTLISKPTRKFKTTREKIDRSEPREIRIRVIHSKTLKLVLNSIVIDVVVVHYDIKTCLRIHIFYFMLMINPRDTSKIPLIFTKITSQSNLGVVSRLYPLPFGIPCGIATFVSREITRCAAAQTSFSN